MTNQEWISLIEEKREELQDAILDAAFTSYETGLVTTVYLYADGDVVISEDMGGNTIAGEVYTGDAETTNLADVQTDEIIKRAKQ